MADPSAVWRRNSPFLYDLLVTSALEWPSLCVAWLPRARPDTHSLVLATYTSGRESNHLLVADITVPQQGSEAKEPKLLFRQSIPHDGEVHAAAVQPSTGTLVATRSPSPVVALYDLSQYPEGKLLARAAPTVRLAGHRSGGYGLAWHPTAAAVLLSAGEDGLILLWDVERGGSPVSTIQGHKGTVEAVAWHATSDWMCAGAGNDRRLILWDTRACTSPLASAEAHSGDIISVAFSPYSDHLLATGSADHTAALWDLRDLSQRLYTFRSHSADVQTVQFSPFHAHILATGSVDTKLKVWDLYRIGAAVTPAEAADGPPELMFTHSGHTARVADFAWSPDEEWTVASTSEDNSLHLWRMSPYVYSTLEIPGPPDSAPARTRGRSTKQPGA